MGKRIAPIVLLLAASVGGNVLAAQTGVQPKSDSCTIFVIQGRITAVAADLVTLKTPDVYPTGKGLRPQWLMSGPTFKIDVSRAKVFFPDGKRIDKRPLAVGDRVVMILKGPSSQSSLPSARERTYSASIIERLMVDSSSSAH